MKHFTLRDVLYAEVMDDEMPAAPGGTAEPGTGEQAFTKEFSGEIDESVYSTVPEMGEAIPGGTYIFRLDSAKPGWSDEPKPGEPEFGFGRQPYFNAKWVCEDEPHTGRAFFEFIPWISDEVAQAAVAGDKVAQGIMTDRIFRLKTIASASGYKPAPGSKFNAKTFIATQPRVKIQLGVGLKKERVNAADGTVTYKDVPGTSKNKVINYMSPFGQAARR